MSRWGASQRPEVSLVVTMREVAALAGVSAKSVSRVMHNDRYISDDVRRRVEDAIRDLNYVPNALARSFRSGRDAAIGVAVPEISDPFFGAVVEAVVQVARDRQAAVFVTSLGREPDGERAAVEALLGRQVAGLITTPVADDQSYLQTWQARTAMVFIDRQPKRLTKFDSVLDDDRGGAHEATAHLIRHGHRRIGFIGDTAAVTTTALRLEGHRAALTESGLAIDPALVVFGATTTDNARAVTRRLLEGPEPPTAIFSSNARCSIAVIPQLHAMGKADTAFISFGDFPLADALDPAISVIDQDPHSMGLIAATRVFERMEHPGRRLKRNVVMPVNLIARASCCGAGDPPLRSQRRRSTALTESA